MRNYKLQNRKLQKYTSFLSRKQTIYTNTESRENYFETFFHFHNFLSRKNGDRLLASRVRAIVFFFFVSFNKIIVYHLYLFVCWHLHALAATCVILNQKYTWVAVAARTKKTFLAHHQSVPLSVTTRSYTHKRKKPKVVEKEYLVRMVDDCGGHGWEAVFYTIVV